MNDDIIAINLKSKDSFEERNLFTCEILGALKTSLEALEKVGDRILYMDTDSLIYVESPGDVSLPTGDLLGDLTDELP